MVVTKKIEKTYEKNVFKETWIEVKSPRLVNLTLTRQLQFHLPNLYVEDQGEPVDEEFQEFEILNEEFEHEDVKDPSQGFVDWDSPPTYDDDVNDKDPIEDPLATNLEEEYEVYGLHPIFGDFYPKKDDQLEDEEPTDDIADYEKGDEEFLGEVPNFNGEEGDYVDFLGVEDILNSPNEDYGELYVDEKNYTFTRETMAHTFLSIFMACESEKE